MVNLILVLVFGVEWQLKNRPLDDFRQIVTVNFVIPQRELKYVARDSQYCARYEIQVIVNNKRNEQLAGDFWQREVLLDSFDIRDSCQIIAPSVKSTLTLKILDLNGGEIVNLTEDIRQIKNLGNIYWTILNDTLSLTFSIFNEPAKIKKVSATLNELEKTIGVRPGNYDTLISFDIQKLAIGEYNIELKAFTDKKRVDRVLIPVKIKRPFYLDDYTWSLRVKQLKYLASPLEIEQLAKAETQVRDSLWRNFWRQYDPTPNTEYNEKEEEYFSRIKYCEENFSHGDKGWESDRAKIYMKFGPPDEIQSRPCELATYPYELWHYYRLNRKFYFVDRYGFGEYMLINPDG